MSIAGAWAYSKLKEPVYEASARVLIQTDNLSTPLLGGPASGTDPARQRATDIQLVSTPAVGGRARRRPEVREEPEGANETIDATAEGDSNVVQIRARSTRARRAPLLAQAIAEEFIRFRKQTTQRRYRATLSAVRRRIRTLSRRTKSKGTGELDGAALFQRRLEIRQNKGELRKLRERARELAAVTSVQTGEAQVVQGATFPVQVEPKLSRNLWLGGLFGALLGVALAFLRRRFDRRLKTTAELEEILPNVPILAFIPTIEESPASRHVAAEGYHALRAGLQSQQAGGVLPRSILITSPMGAEGKSTTTANLAMAMKEHGCSVLVLDADLRRPGLSKGLLDYGAVGVSSLLAGTKTIEECVGEVGFAHSAPNGHGPTFVIDGDVALVPAGAPPEEPRRLFTEHATANLLTKATARSDTVLVDGPPLGMFSDMAPVARQAEAVLLVVRLGHTRKDALQQTVDRLTTLGVTPRGIVVLEAGSEGPPYDAYYGY